MDLNPLQEVQNEEISSISKLEMSFHHVLFVLLGFSPSLFRICLIR